MVRVNARGIFFQMAIWSGPAFQAFAKLTEVIAKPDLEDRIEIEVVDIEGSEARADVTKFLGGVRGAGETVWAATAWSSPRAVWD